MNKLIRAFQILNRCDWYVFFWCLYQMQGILYPQGVINQVVQALIMGWAVYEAYIFMLPQRNLPLMVKATSMLIFMYFIYGGIFIVFGSDFYSTPSAYLKSFVNSFLPFFLFFKYSKDGYLDEERMRAYFLVFLCMSIPQYYNEEAKALLKLRNMGKIRTETTNNFGYYFLSLLPMLFFWYKKRIIQYISLCIILLYVLMGMKRGAIAISGVCAVCFLVDSIKNTKSKKHKYQAVAFCIAVVVLSIATVTYQLANNNLLQQRIESTKEGNSSGRDIIYEKAIDLVVDDTSIVHLLIGRGAFSTIKEMGVLAHNDWLETACDIGLFGILVLTFYYFSFLKTAVDCQRVMKTEYKMCMMMLFFASFSKTFFSMSLQDMPIYVTMPMAFLTYHTYNSKKNLRAEKI